MNTQPYRLFLDDTRSRSSWTLVQTVNDFKLTLETRGIPECVSLDYDLQNTEPSRTGEDALAILLAYLEENSKAFTESNSPFTVAVQ